MRIEDFLTYREMRGKIPVRDVRPSPIPISPESMKTLIQEEDWLRDLSTAEGRSAARQECIKRLSEDLREIRARIVASGIPLLDWDGVEAEVSRARGDRTPDGRKIVRVKVMEP